MAVGKEEMEQHQEQQEETVEEKEEEEEEKGGGGGGGEGEGGGKGHLELRLQWQRNHETKASREDRLYGWPHLLRDDLATARRGHVPSRSDRGLARVDLVAWVLRVRALCAIARRHHQAHRTSVPLQEAPANVAFPK